MFASQPLDRSAALHGLVLALVLVGCSGSDGGDEADSGDNRRALVSASGIISDDFHSGALDTTLWQVVDPQGDGAVAQLGAGTPDAQLHLLVPAGAVHDPWTTNTALRVMQPAADEDFEIEVKFESEPTQAYQSQGLLVEQDDSNYIRFDVYSDGSSLNVFSAAFTNGSPDIPMQTRSLRRRSTYLRLGRVGDQWTARTPTTASTWTTAGTFFHAHEVCVGGRVCGQLRSRTRHTRRWSTTSSRPRRRSTPKIRPLRTGRAVPLTTQSSDGAILRSPDQATYACGSVGDPDARSRIQAPHFSAGAGRSAARRIPRR